MTLNELLEEVNVAVSTRALIKDNAISGLALDSRKVVEGNVFIALAGARQHGLEHANQALVNGAIAVLYEPVDSGHRLAELINNTKSIPFIAIEGLTAKLGEIAARFYGHPSRRLDVIGITGTNGKTSCSQFLAQALEDCGIIGTLGWGESGRLNNTLNTTPDALEIQKILAELLKQGKRTVAMEVSSHGLEQGRVNGIQFKGAVFTNISRDHLDYHETMAAYLKAKLKLLDMPGLEFAVVNRDDAYSKQIMAAVPEHVALWSFSAKDQLHRFTDNSGADARFVAAINIQHKSDGMQFDVCWRDETEAVNVPLYGDFNIENVLTVLTVMLALGMTLRAATEKLSRIKPVVGRMERLGDMTGPLIFVDYAHTPDALDKVLSCAKQHCEGDLWVVFGCGGNRDVGKRPLMGASAEVWADHVMVTDDNPRYENGQDIVNDILTGCRSAKVEVIRNREQAIHKVIKNADRRDCIVIAGKGHEQYQEIEGVRIPFSDSRVALEALGIKFNSLFPEGTNANDAE